MEHEPQPQEPRTELPEGGAAPADGAEPEKKEKKPSEDLFYWLNALTTALVSLVLVFTFIGRLTRVQGESMTNTLQDQQLLLVWSLGYEPKQGRHCGAQQDHGGAPGRRGHRQARHRHRRPDGGHRL